MDKVLQPFDENKFNFTKVGQEEVLFQFEASKDNEIHFVPNAPIDINISPSVVAINVCQYFASSPSILLTFLYSCILLVYDPMMLSMI